MKTRKTKLLYCIKLKLQNELVDNRLKQIGNNANKERKRTVLFL